MIEKILDQILKDFPEDRVYEILDEEILEWVDPDWEEGHDSEYDCYCETGRGEAENVVRNMMVQHYVNNHNSGQKLSEENESDLIDRIREEYDCLGN